MCIRGFTQASSLTAGPASNVLEPPATNPGVTGEEPHTIAETMVWGTDAGINLATADLDAAVARR